MTYPDEAANWRKSRRSYSSGGCVEVGELPDAPADWRKSRRSGNSMNCVEAAGAPAGVLVRDTKDRDGFTLAVDADAWRAFTAALKGGGA